MIRRRFSNAGKRLRSDQNGLTLVELLVAIILLGILLTVVSGLYVSALRTVNLSRDLTANTKSVTNAMNETTRSIRAATENPISGEILNAPAFVTAKSEDVVFYAYVNVFTDLSAAQQPVMIRLRIDRTTGKYVESRWNGTPTADNTWIFPTNPCEKVGTPSGCTAPNQLRTLATTMSPVGAGNVPFIYLDSLGAPIPITNASVGLDETSRRAVAFVKVSLSAQASLTSTANSVLLESVVGIPNLGFAK